jgi:hypothetical protein
MSARKPIAIGTKFHRLTVTGPAPSRKSGQARFWCLCDCGEILAVQSSDLRRGGTKSCGCLKREMCIARDIARTKHGKYRSPEYKAWQALIQRCTNPADKRFHHYGGRGITVCAQWLRSFDEFYADMGPRPSAKHSIDRENNNGHYQPGNCRWATKREQLLNRRGSLRIKFLGESLPLCAWAERQGIPEVVLRQRLARGWSPKKLLTTPKRRWKAI